MEKELKQEARMQAVEYMACHTYNMLLKLIGAQEEAIQAAESEGLNAIGLQQIVKRDPALSDHVSAEMRDAIGDLLIAAKEMRDMAKKT